MAQQGISSSTINRETILKAIHKDNKNEPISTPNIRDLIQPPQGFDLGAKLFGMFSSGHLEKDKDPHSGGNVYWATEKGIDAYQKNIQKVQVFGQYEVKFSGNDQPSPQQILGNSYSTVADQAMTELSEIIEKNATLRGFLQTMALQLDNMFEQMGIEVEGIGGRE